MSSKLTVFRLRPRAAIASAVEQVRKRGFIGVNDHFEIRHNVVIGLLLRRARKLGSLRGARKLGFDPATPSLLTESN